MSKTQSRLLTRIFIIAVVTAVLVILGGQYQLINISNIGDEKKIKTDIIKHDAIKIASTNNTIIWHLPSSHEVCVKLDVASCPYPDLIGRISGSTIAHLDGWERRNRTIYHEHGGGSEEIHEQLTCGSYKNSWLSPDEYNLEIIVILCDSFGLASPKLARNYSQWLEYDFKQICLKDPARNKITLGSSTLTVVDEVSRIDSFHGDENEFMDGRWVMNNNTVMRGPLSTRYQPQDCRSEDEQDELPERCIGPMNNDYVERLNFQWRDNSLVLEKLKRYHFDSIPSKRVCLLGASHSRYIIEGLSAISERLGYHFVKERVKYPSGLSTNLFRRLHNSKYKCTTFVIGVGQHTASNHEEGYPYYSLKKWRDEMTQVVTNQDIFNIHSEIKLILRSIHRMPLGDIVSACPPTDWRSPVVIDSYNSILKDIVRDVNNSRVSFLDTRFITNPVWDSAPDWCHLHSKVSTVEAFYIASQVLFD